MSNWDEPIDPGNLVEVMFAKMLNKPVIGYRTEMRTPYGTQADNHVGMHFFCYFPCDKFISIPNDFMRDKKEGHSVLDKIAEEISFDT